MHEFRRIATHKPIFCQLFINKRKPQTAFHILSRPKSLSEYIVRSQLAVRGSVDCYLYTIHVRDNTPQLRNAILFSAQHVESYAYTNTLDIHAFGSPKNIMQIESPMHIFITAGRNRRKEMMTSRNSLKAYGFCICIVMNRSWMYLL